MERLPEIILFWSAWWLWFLALGSAYRRYALRQRILDVPSERSSHSRPVVRGGGLLFWVAALLAYLMFWAPQYPFFAAGILILGLLGFADDRRNLSPALRFPVQLLAVILILYDAGLFGSGLPVWSLVLIVVAAMGFVNAFNFMDGINGMTGFYTLVLLISFGWINYRTSLFPVPVFLIMAASVLAFGHFNFRRRALMFAGDVGTMALAGFILFVWVKTILDLQAPVLIALLAVYGVDSAGTIILRALHRQNIIRAHRWHVYQKLIDRWQWRHLQVAGIYALIQTIINAIILILGIWKWPLKMQWIFLWGVLVIFVVLFLIMQRDRWQQLVEK